MTGSDLYECCKNTAQCVEYIMFLTALCMSGQKLPARYKTVPSAGICTGKRLLKEDTVHKVQVDIGNCAHRLIHIPGIWQLKDVCICMYE